MITHSLAPLLRFFPTLYPHYFLLPYALPPLIRDWRVGWCVSNPNPIGCSKCRNPCTHKQPRRYFLEEFGIALNRSGAMPVYMLNMLTAVRSLTVSFASSLIYNICTTTTSSILPRAWPHPA